MQLTGSRTMTLLAQINFTYLLCLIVGEGGQIANFGKKPSTSFNDYMRMT